MPHLDKNEDNYRKRPIKDKFGKKTSNFLTVMTSEHGNAHSDVIEITRAFLGAAKLARICVPFIPVSFTLIKERLFHHRLFCGGME